MDTPRPSPRTNRTRRVPHPVLIGQSKTNTYLSKQQFRARAGLIEAQDLVKELVETTISGAELGDDELQSLMAQMDLNGDGVRPPALLRAPHRMHAHPRCAPTASA